jgi:hypothetical protein
MFNKKRDIPLPKRPGQSVLMFTLGEEALTGEFEVVWTGSCYKVTRRIDEEPAQPSEF